MTVDAQRFAFAARSLFAVLALPMLLSLPACGPGPGFRETTSGVSTRLENPQMGIALAAVPEGFKLEGQDAESITLFATGERPGKATVKLGELVRVGGVNLVDLVNAQKKDIESRPDGKFLGQLELGSPMGPAYSTRGRFTDQGVEMEEIRLFTLHPFQNRSLELTYVYRPGGDTTDRMDQAFAILGELEPLASPEPQGAEDTAPSDESP